MNKYIVICTDHGRTSDCLTRIIGTYYTEEEAQTKMTKDVNQYLVNNLDYNLDVDGVSHRIVTNNIGEEVCVWQILEVEV